MESLKFATETGTLRQNAPIGGSPVVEQLLRPIRSRHWRYNLRGWRTKGRKDSGMIEIIVVSIWFNTDEKNSEDSCSSHVEKMTLDTLDCSCDSQSVFFFPRLAWRLTRLAKFLHMSFSQKLGDWKILQAKRLGFPSAPAELWLSPMAFRSRPCPLADLSRGIRCKGKHGIHRLAENL